MNRRGFLKGLIAAPAIVTVGNIMPIKSLIDFSAYEGDFATQTMTYKPRIMTVAQFRALTEPILQRYMNDLHTASDFFIVADDLGRRP